MKDTLLFLAVFMSWLVLSRWVLPWFGVPTCMSGDCAIRRAVTTSPAPQIPETPVVVESKGNEP